ncbi:hypothetical protein M5689_015550 [Euphorbia peplus]|nr:hypothetical protein M5689_015550 [Euphorbia peplus]
MEFSGGADDGVVQFSGRFWIYSRHVNSLKVLDAREPNFWDTVDLRGDDFVGFYLERLGRALSLCGNIWRDITTPEIQDMYNALSNAQQRGFRCDLAHIRTEALSTLMHREYEVELEDLRETKQMLINVSQSYHEHDLPSILEISTKIVELEQLRNIKDHRDYLVAEF